ncbi:hypothetical protein BD779DRAFT_221070 [Infundibulicybe gibba]|nr:hypothetical protein BD779DRAFT_221070 [Infundibulicybe gibba]
MLPRSWTISLLATPPTASGLDPKWLWDTVAGSGPLPTCEHYAPIFDNAQHPQGPVVSVEKDTEGDMKSRFAARMVRICVTSRTTPGMVMWIMFMLLNFTEATHHLA